MYFHGDSYCMIHNRMFNTNYQEGCPVCAHLRKEITAAVAVALADALAAVVKAPSRLRRAKK